MTTLHYIFDPLCGWCYAAEPLVEAAARIHGLQVQLHGGGMMTGERRKQITADWRAYVLPHDDRIAAMSGQPFGDAYRDGLLNDTSVWLDSAPPTTAILAAEQLGGQGLAMLGAIQRAHYVQGLQVAEQATLQALAEQLGLDSAAFNAAYTQLDGAATEAHFAASRRLLAMAGGQGFPTLALQTDEEQPLQRIDVSDWLGQPEAFANALAAHIAPAAPNLAPSVTR